MAKNGVAMSAQLGRLIQMANVQQYGWKSTNQADGYHKGQKQSKVSWPNGIYQNYKTTSTNKPPPAPPKQSGTRLRFSDVRSCANLLSSESQFIQPVPTKPRLAKIHRVLLSAAVVFSDDDSALSDLVVRAVHFQQNRVCRSCVKVIFVTVPACPFHRTSST